MKTGILTCGKRLSLTGLLIGLVLSCTLSGCLLLDHRNAEDPEQNTLGRTPPLTARELLNGLEQAVLSRNPLLYMQQFSDDYLYYPDLEAVSRYGSMLDRFGYGREEQFAHALFARSMLPVDSVGTATFTLLSEQPLSNSIGLEADYSIRLGLTATTARTVQAHASFKLIRGGDGGYLIQEWRDTRVGNSSTIADWKAVIQ